MKTDFVGFPSDTFVFFRALARNNSKAWFDRNRDRYNESVVRPFRSLLEALTPFVLKLDGGFEVAGKTNRNFSRINRDIRFHRDRAPYHTNYYLYFFDSRRNRMDAGRLYVGVNPDGATVGFSIYGERGSLLDRLTKARIKTDGAVLAKYLRRLAVRFESYWYRLEKGEWRKVEGSPKSVDDWRHVNGWVVRKALSPARASAPRFLEDVQQNFAQLYPLYAFSSQEGRAWQRAFRRG